METVKENQKTSSSLLTVRFSIGAKLVIIISIIVLFSLIAFSFLVSCMVQADLRLTAEINNFNVNGRSAAEAENTLASTRSSSLILIHAVHALGAHSGPAQLAIDFFFEQNPHVAALFSDQEERVLLNKIFLETGIDAALVDSYRENHRAVLQRAANGETVILNAAPFFDTPLLALFFQGRAGECVLFSPDSLSNAFDFYGTNKSYMINRDGDILVHYDYDLVYSGVNWANQKHIRDILESPDRIKQKQELVEIGDGTATYWAHPEWDDASMWNNVKITAGWIWEVAKSTAGTEWEKARQGARAAGIEALRLLRIKPKENTQSIDTGDEVRHYLAYTKVVTAGSVSCVVITSIEYSKVVEGIAAISTLNYIISIGVLGFSGLIIWLFAKTISMPLKSLAQAARKIEDGAFEQELKTKRRDEIGVLTASFQQMCTALGIFGKFTNRDIAVKAMRHEIKPGGLPRYATIFFSDIRSFTEISEKFTRAFGDEASDSIVRWLNEYFTRMVECVENTGGVVDKFIGDAVMAHWGAVMPQGDPRKDAFNCIKAALLMRMELLKMNLGRNQENWGKPPIRIGCGINSGIVTAGQIGSDLRMEYTVIGDPVNLASRSESLTKPLCVDILITEDTLKLVRGKVIVEKMKAVNVKGKEKPVQLFAVVNLKSVKSGPKSLAEVRKLLGLETPDLSKVDVNAVEKKYKIGGEE